MYEQQSQREGHRGHGHVRNSLANFRQEAVQAVKSLTSTVFNFSRKRRPFPPSAAPNLCVRCMCAMASGRWEGNTAPNPPTHTAPEVVILAGGPGSGMMLKESFGLSFSCFHLSQGEWTQVEVARLNITFIKYFL